MTSNPTPLLEKTLRDHFLGWAIVREELAVTLSPNGILDALNLLKGQKSLLYTQLMDICVVDFWGKRSLRFEVVYHLLSLVHNSRIRLKVPLDEYASIDSATSFFPCADWWEREAYDMFGIRFDGHPNLERILTDYNFEGFPLRKDFPLIGHVQVRYDIAQQQVVQEPVSLQQAYRSFETTNPWKGYPREDTP